MRFGGRSGAPAENQIRGAPVTDKHFTIDPPAQRVVQEHLKVTM